LEDESGVAAGPLNEAGLRQLLWHVELLPRQLKRLWERWESPICAKESGVVNRKHNCEIVIRWFNMCMALTV
jgi:hypothetical protein